MGKSYATPQGQVEMSIDGQPVTEFVDGIPVDPSTGIPVDKTTGRPAVNPGTVTQPGWVSQLQMPGKPGIAPELVSPVPAPIVEPHAGALTNPTPLTVVLPNQISLEAQINTRGVRVVDALTPTSPLQEAVLAVAETSGPPTSSLPAMPVIPSPPAEPGKCITEGCKSKTKDRGMCAKCLKDTLEYMTKDPKITWEFLEANGLALPSSSARSRNKFLAGLTAKLAVLHNVSGTKARDEAAKQGS